MEEWHQKLHNNSSPDDIVICKALLAYISSGLQLSAYWATLAEAGITRERLASYDRSITSEPHFKPEQCPGLKRDLEAYLATLQVGGVGCWLCLAVLWCDIAGLAMQCNACAHWRWR